MSSLREGSRPPGPPAGGKSATSADPLREIVQSGLDEQNATEALEATLDAVKLRHGALLAYDADRHSLTLLAQRNLHEDAQKAMRKIQRGVTGSWDMPLHSLLQRRVYMIERPKENPFVPTLLEGSDQSVLTNLVFLPLYASGQASGVLLLAGSGTRAIREPDIVALREHARLLGAALAESELARRRKAAAEAEAAKPTPAFDRMSLVARITELEALVESLRKASAAPTSTEVERRLLEATRERDRLHVELETREIELVNLRSEVSLLRDRGTGDTERSRKLAGELARAKEQIAALTDRERLAEETRERAERSRAEIELRIQGLERRLAKSAEHAKETQAERAALSMRAAEAQAEADELRRAATAREALLNDLRAERDRLSAALQSAAERAQQSQDALGHLREDTEETTHALRLEIDALRGRLQAVERERDHLRSSTSGHSTVIDEIARETESIRAELARETERRRAAEETSSSVIRDASALREELERNEKERGALEAATASLRAEVDRLTGELGRAAEGRAGLKESLQAAETRAQELGRRLAVLERDRGDVESETGRLQSELEAARKREDELTGRLSSAESERHRLEADVERARADTETAREEAAAAARERDAIAERSGSLDTRIETLLREAEALRVARAEAEEQAERLRLGVGERDAQLAALRSELEAARAESQRLHDEVGSRLQGEEAAAAVRAELGTQLEELRRELESAQARGSRLTEELETHRRVEGELRQANAELETELRQERARLDADADERSRAARESITRLEAALQAERAAAQAAREQAESERREAGELASHVEQLRRKLHEAESASEAAGRRAAELAEEQAAATETSKSLAADLGRRAAEIQELGERLRTHERQLREAEEARRQAAERVRTLEESVRTSASEMSSLRHQLARTEEEKSQLLQDQDLRFAELQSHATQLEEQLTAGAEERDRLLEQVRELEAAAARADEVLQQQTAQGGNDDALVEARAQIERLSSELESLRGQGQTLEAELRTARSDAGKWQALNEKLQRAVDERDRDLVGLRGAIAALRKRAPEAAGETPAASPEAPAPAAEAPAAKPAAPPPAAAPPAPKRRPVELTEPAPSPSVFIFDEEGPSVESLAQLCRNAGLEARRIANGEALQESPQLIAVNLLSGVPSGLEAIRRTRTDDGLRARPLVLYAAKPGSGKGVLLPNVDCLVRPIEETDFARAVAGLIGKGKRITIIGEDLDSVLRFNGWASATGCSVSSAGDLKQGNDLLEIVKPDLIVFDFTRLSGESAGLIVKVRRNARLASLPVLLALPEPLESPSTAIFLRRLAALAEETALDLSPLAERLRPAEPGA